MMELETFFTVSDQTKLLFGAILLGIPLGLCFDVLRTLRVLIQHGKIATALEDVAFLLLWGASLLCYAVVMARGEVRGYYMLGSALGFLLYRCTLGNLVVPLLRRIFEIMGRFLRWAGMPFINGIVRICSVLKEKFGHFAKLFVKDSFFLHLPLIADRKVLYNKGNGIKREVTRKWQKRGTRRKSKDAGSFGSSAGQQ